MMSGRTMMQGYAGKIGDDRTVHIDIRGGDEWVYAELVGTKLEVWSGPACKNCVLSTRGLERCLLHADVELIALQLRFA
jgi:hypothetical protein